VSEWHGLVSSPFPVPPIFGRPVWFQSDTSCRADYLSLSRLNWQTFNEEQLDLWQGITLYHAPGHTPGLCIMQVNLPKDGTWIWTTDQYHVRENYHDDHPHGWLIRDYRSWIDSGKKIKRLQRLFQANLIFGHDYGVAEEFIKAKKFYE